MKTNARKIDVDTKIFVDKIRLSNLFKFLQNVCIIFQLLFVETAKFDRNRNVESKEDIREESKLSTAPLERILFLQGLAEFLADLCYIKSSRIERKKRIQCASTQSTT